jgi:hypothetical protein
MLRFVFLPFFSRSLAWASSGLQWRPQEWCFWQSSGGVLLVCAGLNGRVVRAQPQVTSISGRMWWCMHGCLLAVVVVVPTVTGMRHFAPGGDAVICMHVGGYHGHITACRCHSTVVQLSHPVLTIVHPPYMGCSTPMDECTLYVQLPSCIW